MNDLTWFIYFANILPNLAPVIGFSLLFVVGALGVLGAIHRESGSRDPDRWDHVEWKKGVKFHYIAVCLLPLFTLLAFIPSERTLYMMAASEMGEKVVQTKEFEQVRGIIKKKLDEYTKQ